MERRVRSKFPDLFRAIKPRPIGDKYGRANYHVGYRAFRASSWGKLPPLWFLARQHGQDYDFIWFVDSDATPNPLHHNISLGRCAVVLIDLIYVLCCQLIVFQWEMGVLDFVH